MRTNITPNKFYRHLCELTYRNTSGNLKGSTNLETIHVKKKKIFHVLLLASSLKNYLPVCNSSEKTDLCNKPLIQNSLLAHPVNT